MRIKIFTNEEFSGTPEEIVAQIHRTSRSRASSDEVFRVEWAARLAMIKNVQVDCTSAETWISSQIDAEIFTRIPEKATTCKSCRKYEMRRMTPGSNKRHHCPDKGFDCGRFFFKKCPGFEPGEEIVPFAEFDEGIGKDELG